MDFVLELRTCIMHRVAIIRSIVLKVRPCWVGREVELVRQLLARVDVDGEALLSRQSWRPAGQDGGAVGELGVDPA